MDKSLLYRILAQARIICSSIVGRYSLQKTGEDSRVGWWTSVGHLLFMPVLLSTCSVAWGCLLFRICHLNLLVLVFGQSSTWRSRIVSQFRSRVTAEAGWEEKRLDREAPNPDRKYLFWVMPFSSPEFSSMTGFANVFVELLERSVCLEREDLPFHSF